MFKELLFLHRQLRRTVSQDKQHPVARVELAEHSEEQLMPLKAHTKKCQPLTLAGPMYTSSGFTVTFPHLSSYMHSSVILCKHILLNLCTPHLPALLNHIILPSLCMAKWHIHLHLTFQTSGLAPFIPTYSLHIPKGPHLSIFHSTVQYIHPPIAKRTYTM